MKKFYNFFKAVDKHYNYTFSGFLMGATIISCFLYIWISLPAKLQTVEIAFKMMLIFIGLRIIIPVFWNIILWFKNSFFPTIKKIADKELFGISEETKNDL